MGRRIITKYQLQKDSPKSRQSITAAAKTTAMQSANRSETKAAAKTVETTDPIAAVSLDSTPATDDYISKLIKYIPTEIVTLYLLVDGILKSFSSAPVINWVIFFLLLVLTPVYIWRMTRDTAKKAAWDQIIVSFFSFGLWVYVIGGPFSSVSWYVPQYGSILIAVFTVFVPLLKK